MAGAFCTLEDGLEPRGELLVFADYRDAIRLLGLTRRNRMRARSGP